MTATLKKLLPILCISTAVAVGLNYLSYQAIIKISQAQLGSIPEKLIAEILLNIALHTFLLSAAPLALSAKNKHISSYVALAIISSLYLTFMAGVNAAGPVIAVIIIGALAFYGYKKAQDIYNYVRAK